MSQFPTPPGSYIQTSRNISFGPSEKTPGCYTLSATCQAVNGAWVESNMEFGITNNNGNLEWNPTENKGSGYQYPDVPEGLPAGTYLKSSSDAQLIANNGGGDAPFTLKALANDRNGVPQEASMSYDIANCDGKLKFNPKYGC